MSVRYDPVHWTPHKILYDRLMLLLLAVYLIGFSTLQILLFPEITIETLIIRATGVLAFLMLHVILIIGPICRLNPHFLPLLYNRRHLGVTMFMVALVHGTFNVIQFHGLGNIDPLVSVLSSNLHYGSLSRFPFQAPGFIALLILFVMAATSHDFWLKNLHPFVWKSLHMGVYVAYLLLLVHVMFGVIQLERSPVFLVLPGAGMFLLIGLHLAAALKQRRHEKAALPQPMPEPAEDVSFEGFVYACDLEDIPENRAKLIIIGGENIALFKYDGKVSGVHNLCKHQNGPLSEGKIIDGCITCPWHGYQYLPDSGQSPPPFEEKVATYDVQIYHNKHVFVNPKPHPEGTARPPARFEPGKNNEQ